jgi:TfoX/Sxy family transcriptional regulator of competence genes
MSFDEKLAERTRRALSSAGARFRERHMFGGLCFMVRGHMRCGVLGNELVVKVGPEQTAQALAKPHTRAFDFTGKPSRGAVYVSPSGLKTPGQLDRWLRVALDASATAPKRTTPRAAPRRSSAERSMPGHATARRSAPKRAAAKRR